MEGSHFKVRRVLGMWVRNSFLPVVIGDIAQGEFGTEVRIRMRLHAGVAAFMVFWFGFLVLFGGRLVYSAATKGSARPEGTGLAVMALFAYGLMSISFWTEVKKARLLLRDGLGVGDSDVLEE